MMNPKQERAAKLMLSHGVLSLVPLGRDCLTAVCLLAAWGEDVEECHSALVDFFQTHALDYDTPIWFCVYANYQPQDGFGPSVQELLDMRVFAAVISAPSLRPAAGGFGMAAVHTCQEDLYGRLWCVHEVDEALEQGVPVRAAMSAQYLRELVRRSKLFLEQGALDVQECIEAAGIFVNTVKAKCGHVEDERCLIGYVYSKPGGFARLNSVISEFRQLVLPPEVRQQLSLMAALRQLEDEDRLQRAAAVEKLPRLLEHERSEAVLGALCEYLEARREVREGAVQVLSQLPAEALAVLVHELGARLQHSSLSVREAALEVLGVVADGAVLAQVLPQLVGRLEDQDFRLRDAALALLRRAPAERVREIAPELVLSPGEDSADVSTTTAGGSGDQSGGGRLERSAEGGETEVAFAGHASVEGGADDGADDGTVAAKLRHPWLRFQLGVTRHFFPWLEVFCLLVPAMLACDIQCRADPALARSSHARAAKLRCFFGSSGVCALADRGARPARGPLDRAPGLGDGPGRNARAQPREEKEQEQEEEKEEEEGQGSRGCCSRSVPVVCGQPLCWRAVQLHRVVRNAWPHPGRHRKRPLRGRDLGGCACVEGQLPLPGRRLDHHHYPYHQH